MKALVFCTLLLVAGPACASSPREPDSIVVSTRGVDFSNPSDVSALHYRLRFAAKAVCNSDHDEDIAIRDADNRCRVAALAAAMRDVSRLQLSAAEGASVSIRVRAGR